ncbi:MAG: methylenetetrahydrofolate--tRNA-(uracil(54)-C(5))-methyltransferase (FADH(2)-oxidizing) TrmFO [Oscillospiraceae bacterium]|nr:methylenetetrahydrofolate--tRNA-(uracil(54)-C(5))-methyltransferase (FADH(2)-oxidizing) TrmFO [Oscillospiraceae bacterium]
MTVSVIGAGLAGVEAAHALSRQGFHVKLHEMKPQKYSPAHKFHGFAELVCSNSLKSNEFSSAAGLLKAEMRLLGSLVLEVAEQTKVNAGGALAVDREAFSEEITRRIHSNPNIEVIAGEISDFPNENAVICTGPLTSDTFAAEINKKCKFLHFYDAAAPIVTLESINLNKAFFGNRYGKNGNDYLNCPFTEEEYNVFYNALISAETAPLKSFDRPAVGGGISGLPNEEKDFRRNEIQVYEGCMPVEILAKRGRDSVRYGCMKPVGFTYASGASTPNTGKRPYALVQLRTENNRNTLFNIVGFQTNLKFGEQERVFRLIPGLENAEFVRFGVMHRNTFLDSPRLLDRCFCLKGSDNVYFAGQITGTEGYTESAAGGIIAGLALAARLKGENPLVFPETTMLGALSHYISDESILNFQPMGANMGLLPPLNERIKGKKERYEVLAQRALKDFKAIL